MLRCVSKTTSLPIFRIAEATVHIWKADIASTLFGPHISEQTNEEYCFVQQYDDNHQISAGPLIRLTNGFGTILGTR